MEVLKGSEKVTWQVTTSLFVYTIIITETKKKGSEKQMGKKSSAEWRSYVRSNFG
jgi:hypothetical protein